MTNSELQELDSKTTILDLARQLGLSRTTVSAVLSGKAKGYKISDSTAKRVTETARQMEYVPHHWARKLRLQKTNIISVILDELGIGWTEELVKGIDSVLRPNRYNSILEINHHDVSAFRDGINTTFEHRCEGIICRSTISHLESYERIIKSSTPLVFAGDYLEQLQTIPGLNYVMWDDVPAIKNAIKYFVSIGRKHISFVGYRHGVVSDLRRFNAYKQTLNEEGLIINENWHVWEAPGTEAWAEQLRRMFEKSGERPDAIFALNDSIAISVWNWLDMVGLRVPDDVAILGIGDFSITKLIGLSSIHEPIEEMGCQAALTVLELIENRGMAPIQKHISCNRIVNRKTG